MPFHKACLRFMQSLLTSYPCLRKAIFCRFRISRNAHVSPSEVSLSPQVAAENYGPVQRIEIPVVALGARLCPCLWMRYLGYHCFLFGIILQGLNHVLCIAYSIFWFAYKIFPADSFIFLLILLI